MKQPSVTIVVETITSRVGATTGSLIGELQRTLAGIARQSYPRERIETIVALDTESADVEAGLRRAYPDVRFTFSPQSNYFAAKNAGVACSSGEIIAMLDGDCTPSETWLEVLLSRFEDGVDVVAGCTRYDGRSFLARTLSVPDFAYVTRENGDEASGFNLNNVAFRRELLITHPLDERIRRNGGCYLLFHQLRADGFRIVYEPRATVAHGIDFRGFGFVRKHFERGRDGVDVYRLDDRLVLKGTRWFRRTGALGLPVIYARRIAVDWLRMLRRRREIGLAVISLPYYAAVTVMIRLIELAGAFACATRPQASR